MTNKQIIEKSRNNTIPNSKFVNTKGWLNSYALSCGYIQNIQVGGNCVFLEGDNAGYIVSSCINGVWLRKTFHHLPTARKYFLASVKILSQGI